VCSCFLRYNRLVRENTRQPFLRGLYHLPYFSPWSTRHCSVATTQPALCAHDMDSVNFHIQVLEYKSLRILQAVKRCLPDSIFSNTFCFCHSRYLLPLRLAIVRRPPLSILQHLLPVRMTVPRTWGYAKRSCLLHKQRVLGKRKSDTFQTLLVR
jgi:hypothetical protein